MTLDGSPLQAVSAATVKLARTDGAVILPSIEVSAYVVDSLSVVSTNVNFLLYSYTNLSCRANVTVTDLITFASLISQFFPVFPLFSYADFHLVFTINVVLSRQALCETVLISDSGFGVHAPFKLSIVSPRTTFNVCFVENYVWSYVIQNLFQ